MIIKAGEIKCTVPYTFITCIDEDQSTICIRERMYNWGKTSSAQTKTIFLRSAYILSTIRTVVTEICVFYSSCLLLNGFRDRDIRYAVYVQQGPS